MIVPGSGEWAPGIGDPTAVGWFTVFAYAGVAVLCARNMLRARPFPVERTVWAALAALLALLAINKQLDLQTWFTVVGRELSRQQGWYAQRHTVQMAFVASLVLLSISLLLVLHHVLGPAWRRYAIVSCGLALLLTFIVIRAATFHHVDLLLGMRIGPLRVNHLMELGAIAIVALGALAWRPPAAQPGAAPATPT